MEIFYRLLERIQGSLGNIVLLAPAALIAMTVHELSHGLAAYALGDETAKNEGRLSLNPLRHIDIAGTLALIFLGFGWAKPVHVNPGAFKRPKQGMALTAIAGPASNFVLSFLMVFFLFVATKLAPASAGPVVLYLENLALYTAILSIGLGVFNLIPIPPLDGSKVLFALLPDRAYRFVLRYERYGFILVIILCFTGAISGPLGFLVSRVFNLITAIFGFSYLSLG